MYGSLFRRSDTTKVMDAPCITQPSITVLDPFESSVQRPSEDLSASTSRTPLVDEFQKPVDTAAVTGTIWSGFINLTNTIVGAGMLGLPGAFAGTGIAGGSILILLGSLFSAHGLILLSKAAQRTGLPSSFYSAARATVPKFTILIDLAVALKCFGVATGYLITVGDCMVDAMGHILGNGDLYQSDRLLLRVILSRQFWVVGAVIAVSPFSFYRKLDDLKKTSALALIFVFFLAFGIIFYAHDITDACPNGLDECRGEVVAFTDVPTTLSKLPIFIFAFTCHQNIFPIVNELQHRTQERLNWIIFASIGFALILFYVVAIHGYNTFGSNVQGDILLNYPSNGYVTSLRISISLMLALHYPLQLDPSRRCISSLAATVKRWNDGFSEKYCRMHQPDIENETPTEPADGIAKKSFEKDEGQTLLRDDNFFHAVTILFLLLSFSVAMLVDDLGIVLAAVGCTGSTLVTFILPGLIYLNLRSSWDYTKLMACLQLMLGCFIMPIALYFVVTRKISH